MNKDSKNRKRRKSFQSRKCGWYAMHRGWQDNPVFAVEPYTEREAWEWLISEAAFEQKRNNILGKPVLLMRGQLSHSLRFLANKWDWDDSKVWRYLKKLQKWEMIEVGSETGQNIVTLCNYEKYQFLGYEYETEGETPIEREKRQVQNKE